MPQRACLRPSQSDARRPLGFLSGGACPTHREGSFHDQSPLLALAIAPSASASTEFTPMGMLPLIAGDLGVSSPPPPAGQRLCAGRADRCAADDACLRRPHRRRRLLVGLMGIFTHGGNFWRRCRHPTRCCMVARIVTSSTMALSSGVGSVVRPPAWCRRKSDLGRGGDVFRLTIATRRRRAAGPPGWARPYGWRAAFWGNAAIARSPCWRCACRCRFCRPKRGGDIRRELAVVTRGPVLAALALTVPRRQRHVHGVLPISCRS